MNILNNLKQLSLTKIYICWGALLVLLMIIWTVTGRYQEMMSQAVSKVSSQIPADISPEAMVTGFIIISVIVALITIGIGYFLVIFAEKGKRWAQWLFLLFCLWPFVSHVLDVWDSGTIRQMYPDLSLQFYEVAIAVLSLGIMWVLAWKTISLLMEKQEVPVD